MGLLCCGVSSCYSAEMCLSSPRNPRNAWLGFGLRGGTKGAHAQRAEGTCLKEGTTAYDECEWACLRGVELPRVRLNILDQHVGQGDGVLCLVTEWPAVRGQAQGGKGTGAQLSN